MNAKTKIRKRVANNTLLENRIRLIFIYFCLFISITVIYSQSVIASRDGEDVAMIDCNTAICNVLFFGSEEPAFNSKNVFDQSDKIEIIAISSVYSLK